MHTEVERPASLRTQRGAPASWIARFVIGAALNAVAWVSAWARIGPLAHYSFFPLWLGFILVVDALTEARSDTSLWRRNRRAFVALFLVSAPFWWYFERLNRYVGNWHYLTARPYGTAAYVFWASLAFSTVIPAVLSVAELLGTFGGRAAPNASLPHLPARVIIALVAVGIVAFALALIFPRQCFPFIWLSLLFILDPINDRGGERSILGCLRARAYAPVVRLMAAGLICGFLWEMWNYWSLPQWYYTVPYVGFGKIFAMPILGYGGYLPFALEIFAVYHFARLLTRRLRLFPANYVRI
ncbi:MAG: hypothetical protein LC793_18360 [Thermomicrobia bacterium]|nr:hypothetical protein [Thermomicrobia bacterium]MCA1725055.1 hypothetical protein [Thermomicrobia bacterium]